MARKSFSVLFFIKKGKLLKNGEAPVCMRITVNGCMVDISIKRSCPVNLWNQAKENSKGKDRMSVELNHYLEITRSHVHQIYRELETSGKVITVDLVRKLFYGVDEDNKTLLQVFKEHNEQSRKLIGKDFVSKTVQRYETTTRYLEEFIKKEYNLHPAERKERAERPKLKKVDYAAGDMKHQVSNTVKAACYGYRFRSFGEYKALLATCNVCAEEVKGEINGRPYQGIVYSAMNDKGEKVGNPVKASRIGKSVGYEAVQRRMEKSGEAIRNGKLKERTRKIVATAMQTTRNRRELERELKKQGIDVVFRQNDSRRIYGVTFIDHDSRVVLNGFRLGKEYSANVFNERFSGETEKMHQPEVSVPQQEQPPHQEQPDFMPKTDIVSGVASVLGAFGGLLGGGVSGSDEPQDTAAQKRKKKKKRARRID